MQISYATLQDLLQQAYHEGIEQGRKFAFQDSAAMTREQAQTSQVQGLSGISGGRG